MHLNSFNIQNIYHVLLQQGFKVVTISTPGKLVIDIINIHDFKQMKSPFNKIPKHEEQEQGLLQE
tara:strand:+ start:115 stop:309 length:195 start_codon:yes stop_codon:yes gene_type:complete